VHTQHLSVDDGRERHVVKHLCAILPRVCAAVLAKTLVIEAVLRLWDVEWIYM
jgi:hypothetical protein